MDFNGINALVIGKGISGTGAANALKLLGAKVRVVETQTVPPEAEGVDLIVVSPSLKPYHPIFGYAALKDIKLVGEIGLGAMINDKPIIGVTGTNGKTTVVDMLGAIYKEAGICAAVCGNIGVSFAHTAALGNYDRIILELSSFQLMHASPLSCNIACITNIDDDHIDYHGSFFEYKRAKLSITDGQTASDYLLTDASSNLAISTGAQRIDVFPIDFEISATGAHNRMNAGFAATTARLDGIDEIYIRAALRNYNPRSYRITLSAEINGTKFYNDSKGTNISATIAAANSMEGSTALIVGGSDKGAKFEKLFRALPESVKCVFACGQTADKIIEAAGNCSYGRIIKCLDLADAVQNAAQGGFCNILFSPACASFDRYKSYEQRGAVFDMIVKGLII